MTKLKAMTHRLKSIRDEFLALYRDYEESWVSAAVSTAPADRSAAAEDIRDAYRCTGKNENIRFIWFDSLPGMELGYRISLMDGKRDSLSQSLRWRLAPELPEAIWEALRPPWQAIVEAASLGEFWRERSLADQFDVLLRSFVGHSARQISFQQLERESPFAALAPELGEFQADLPTVARAWFCRHVLHDGDQTASDGLLEACVAAARACLWWCPFEGAVLLCNRPAEVHLKEGRLHRDGGPAVRWRDGIQTWALNGVLVSRRIAETPFDRLDPHLIFEERNAEVCREIVRKIGVERLCRDLGANTIDRAGDYELLVLTLWHGSPAPYLKMRNPSLGTYHVEGVHPDCRSVADALVWRNGSMEVPVTLT